MSVQFWYDVQINELFCEDVPPTAWGSVNQGTREQELVCILFGETPFAFDTTDQWHKYSIYKRRCTDGVYQSFFQND